MESSRQRYFYFPLKRIFLENSEEKNKNVYFSSWSDEQAHPAKTRAKYRQSGRTNQFQLVGSSFKADDGSG